MTYKQGKRAAAELNKLPHRFRSFTDFQVLGFAAFYDITRGIDDVNYKELLLSVYTAYQQLKAVEENAEATPQELQEAIDKVDLQERFLYAALDEIEEQEAQQ